MFVLEARSAAVALRDDHRLRSVVRRLDGDEYPAVVERMLAAVEDVAALERGTLAGDWLAPQPFTSQRRAVPEVFLGDTAVYLLVPTDAELEAWELRPQDREAGLDSFCAAVSSALVDAGAVSDDDWPQWQQRDTTRTSHVGANGVPAVVGSDVDRQAAAVLADDDARSFIAELVRSGSSITDLDDSPMAQYSTLGDLQRHGLIEREYVIICRQDHRTLGRLSGLDETARQSILQLSCPTCGRGFSDELLRQVHAPSRVASELIRDGRWRVAWVLGMLADHGVDLERVEQSTGSGGNGRGLVVDTLHGRLLVELPEAEFGMQHAHALIRRLRRQQIEFGLVLSTEPVTNEARRYLSDRQAMAQGPRVSVLEGSDAIARELPDAVTEWSILSARMLAEELVDVVGADLGAIIEAGMRRVAGGASERAGSTIDLRDDDASRYRYRDVSTADEAGEDDPGRGDDAPAEEEPAPDEAPSDDDDTGDLTAAERSSNGHADAVVTDLPSVASGA